jgi:hypothetical protein
MKLGVTLKIGSGKTYKNQEVTEGWLAERVQAGWPGMSALGWEWYTGVGGSNG